MVFPIRSGPHHDADHASFLPVRRSSASWYFCEVLAITSGGSLGAGGALFQSSCLEVVAHVLLVEASAGWRPRWYVSSRPEARGIRRERLVDEDAACPRASTPNSNLVSAMMMPRSSGVVGGLLVEADRRRRAPSCARALADQLAAICSKEMFSSWWPASALVAGVKIGCGQLRGAAAGPAAARCRRPCRYCWYSFQPEPLEVAAHHRLDRQRLQLLHHDRAALHLRLLAPRRVDHASPGRCR